MTTATMETELVLVAPVVPTTLSSEARARLESELKSIFSAAEPLCVKARQIVVSDELDRPGMDLAHNTRRAIAKIRIAGEKKRVEIKDDSLRTSKAIDGLFMPILNALSAHEEYLELQEKFAEIQAKQRKAELKTERDGQIAALGFDPNGYNTDGMTAEAFDACLGGIKAQKQAAIEAAAKAEADRIAEEQAATAERERIRAENERLKAEAAEREAALQTERAKAAEERRINDEANRLEREAIAAKAKSEREAAEAEARIQREAREKLEAEQRVKDEAERKRKDSEAKAVAKAARAPDKAKILAFTEALGSVAFAELKSSEAKALRKQIDDRLGALIQWIEDQAAAL